MGAVFGPAGSSESFKRQKNLSLQAYLNSFGLKAYELQCGMGVRISEKRKVELKDSLLGFSLSIHAPYYISLSSVDEKKRKNSVEYILKTARLANEIGANRIVVHSGSCRNLNRADALKLAKQTLSWMFDALENEHLSHVQVCLETMGKVNQLGTLDEVLQLCKVSGNSVPCIDFGHLHARTFGGLKTKDDYEQILTSIENALGFEVLNGFHAHFSKIEYSLVGGEKKHLTFADEVFGPRFEPLAQLIAVRNLSPVFICESAGTQAEDAMTMKKIYEGFLNV